MYLNYPYINLTVDFYNTKYVVLLSQNTKFVTKLNEIQHTNLHVKCKKFMKIIAKAEK